MTHKINELSLEQDIKLLPFTNEIDKIYMESELFIFLSLYESFGNVVAEAILTGLPVLCNRIPALTELISDDMFFIKDLNPALIAERIIWFKENYTKAVEKLKPIYSYLKNYLNNERIIKEIEILYNEF